MMYQEVDEFSMLTHSVILFSLVFFFFFFLVFITDLLFFNIYLSIRCTGLNCSLRKFRSLLWPSMGSHRVGHA